MLTPNGLPAKQIEKLMLLSLWANKIKEEQEKNNGFRDKKFILAGLGKPTYPVNSTTVAAYLDYWQQFTQTTNGPDPVSEQAIDYGNPHGDLYPRTLMAESMTRWYQTRIHADNILFTVGGVGALRVVFDTLNSYFSEIPGYRVLTPLPYHGVYATNPMHRLHPIPVMKTKGYQFTAATLKTSIQEAYSRAQIDGGLPKALLMCNPSNPLGTVIPVEEMTRIAEVLRQYPELYIIIDEAYIEMSYVPAVSLLQLAPDLQPRMVVLRSATKALSAAGERMAMLMAFCLNLMQDMVYRNMSYFIHAPRSAQLAYAQTMMHFDTNEQQRLQTYYQKKVDYVQRRLIEMDAAMPDPDYRVQGAFYVLADLHELFGRPLPPKAQYILQKGEAVTTDEELAYYLLVQEHLMIAPLSYFGVSPQKGYMRITCSAPEEELCELMNRLELQLSLQRKLKETVQID
ncbi:MAG: pyridoxal phosphate-dependent aminotransferase [Legionella sp.]|nr:pyridoxal phosphate-dependent aminotransferase [Legionella sp.]